MKLKIIAYLIGFVLISHFSFSQNNEPADSVLKIIAKQNDYAEKVITLQSAIKALMVEKTVSANSLSNYGYQLALKNNDIKNQGEFLRLIGRGNIQKGEIDSATIFYYKSLELLENTEFTKPLGLLLDDLARVYRKLEQTERALNFYDKALALYEKENDLEGIARINNESGVIYRNNGDFETAEKRFQKSLAIQTKRNDSIGIGYALEFLGYNHLAQKNYIQAEEYLIKAMKIRSKQNEIFPLMLNYTALAEFYRETKDFTKSNTYYEKSNQLADKIDYPDIKAYNYQKIALNYETLKEYEKALQNYRLYNSINDSLYNSKKIKDIEEISSKYETVKKEKQILAQKAELAKKELALKNKGLWISGLSFLAILIALIGFILYKQQVFKYQKQLQYNELQLAKAKIESQEKLEEQRLTISRDLHDNIGAQLAFIVSAIETIKYFFDNKNTKVTEKLNHIGMFAKETIQELRDTIWAMNKSEVTLQDLSARIANFTEKAQKYNHTIQVDYSIDPSIQNELTFNSFQGLNIFRITQEALSNAIKHAEAKNITISIKKLETGIKFQISDDGKGFNEDNIEAGNGLSNMRKRALDIGNQLEINSKENGGTTVQFTIHENGSSIKNNE